MQPDPVGEANGGDIQRGTTKDVRNTAGRRIEEGVKPVTPVWLVK